jgi:CDP-glycerol glycerophosphotransferase (TagB/SpsB family)
VSGVLGIRTALVRLGFAIGRLLPLRRRVVLATSHADRVGGNLAWIREGLATTRPGIPIVELAHRPWGRRWARTRAAVEGIRAGYLLATSRLFVVDDYFFPMYAVRPRAGTTFVQVWHACGAFKKFGYSVADKGFGADETRLAALPIHTNYDLCLVSADRFAPAYAEAFRQPLERFTARLGIPRTDLFFDQDRGSRIAADVRRGYAIPGGKRVILYAPTFRGERATRARTPDELDLEQLAAVLAADHMLLLRAHPFVAPPAVRPAGLDGFVIDASDHPDMNELMLVSDVLVTDYSSAMYEFALLGRPIVFFAPDHAAYEAERGFYFDFRTGVPGPIFETTTDLADYLRAGEFDVERVRRFAAESFDVADGRATSRFITEVVDAALDG